MHKTRIIILLLFVTILSACAQSKHNTPANVITSNDSGTKVKFHQGQTFSVSLWGNSSTGYLWEVVPESESILVQQGYPQFVPDSNAVGSGGMYTFTFNMIAVGNATLQLIYHRPWETGVPPLQTFEVNVTVTN